MKLLDDYFDLQKEIYDYFGYTENWVAIPLEDATEYYWFMPNDNCVRFSETKDKLHNEEAGEYYENQIYTQRFLSKWVYLGENYTMICVDTRTDGNKFLMVVDNKKECKNNDFLSERDMQI